MIATNNTLTGHTHTDTSTWFMRMCTLKDQGIQHTNAPISLALLFEKFARKVSILNLQDVSAHGDCPGFVHVVRKRPTTIWHGLCSDGCAALLAKGKFLLKVLSVNFSFCVKRRVNITQAIREVVDYKKQLEAQELVRNSDTNSETKGWENSNDDFQPICVTIYAT